MLLISPDESFLGLSPLVLEQLCHHMVEAVRNAINNTIERPITAQKLRRIPSQWSPGWVSRNSKQIQQFSQSSLIVSPSDHNFVKPLNLADIRQSLIGGENIIAHAAKELLRMYCGKQALYLVISRLTERHILACLTSKEFSSNKTTSLEDDPAEIQAIIMAASILSIRTDLIGIYDLLIALKLQMIQGISGRRVVDGPYETHVTKLKQKLA